MLHRDCMTRVQYLKYCPRDNITLNDDEIVKGYEYEKGRYVVVGEDELENFAPEETRSIDILDFVEESEVDPIFFQKTYYLSPQGAGEKAYRLLAEALKGKGKAAVARLVIREKQQMALIREKDGLLEMETMYMSDEIRDKEEIKGTMAKGGAADKELELAEDLIERMSSHFEPDKYHDTYREKLKGLIDKKIKGEEVVVPEAVEAKVVDLMTALKESVEQVSRGKREGDEHEEAKEREKVPVKR